MKSKWSWVLGLLLLFPSLAGAAGLQNTHVWMSTQQTFQFLGQSGLMLEPGWQAAVANLHLYTTIYDGMDVYSEFYLGSRNHLGYLMDREGYVMLTRFPDNVLGLNQILNYFKIKAGHFEIDFGNARSSRSDNGEVQANSLVGNAIVDPNTVEGGMELIGNLGPLGWVAGLSNGLTTEGFMTNRHFAAHGKLSYEPADKTYVLAFSYYRVDQSDTSANTTELFAANRSNSRYATVIDGPSDGNAGQAKMGRGVNIEAWQLDAATRLLDTLEVKGIFGKLVDADLNGSSAGEPVERWTYFVAESKWTFCPGLYLAARYSEADADTYKDVAMNAKIRRAQAGIGFWMTPEMLLKTEYVFQQYSGFVSTAGQYVNSKDTRSDYTDNPNFSGLIMEVSVPLQLL